MEQVESSVVAVASEEDEGKNEEEQEEPWQGAEDMERANDSGGREGEWAFGRSTDPGPPSR